MINFCLSDRESYCPKCCSEKERERESSSITIFICDFVCMENVLILVCGSEKKMNTQNANRHKTCSVRHKSALPECRESTASKRLEYTYQDNSTLFPHFLCVSNRHCRTLAAIVMLFYPFMIP